jgi:hypothetical protein
MPVKKKAYIAYIFAHVYILNQSLQSKVISTLHVQDKVSSMIAELELWGEHLSRGGLDSFPSLHDFVVKSGEDLDVDVLHTSKEHSEGLKRSLRKHFHEPDNSFE